MALDPVLKPRSIQAVSSIWPSGWSFGRDRAALQRIAWLAAVLSQSTPPIGRAGVVPASLLVERAVPLAAFLSAAVRSSRVSGHDEALERRA
jgi:hypothetical protein